MTLHGTSGGSVTIGLPNPTADQLAYGLDLLVDGAITHDMHPMEVIRALQVQIGKMRDMILEAHPDDPIGKLSVDQLSLARGLK